jgi:hypothetical protein
VAEIVLAVAVFLLTVAVVGLFAMMGELASRVPAPEDEPDAGLPPQPFEDAVLGAEAAGWPAGIAHLAEAEQVALVVLSPVCTTCRRIASGATGPLRIPAPAGGVVVSCPNERRGVEFIDEHPMLREYPVALDVEGSWLTANFGVDISPCVLVFERGRLRSAHTFTTATSLAQLSIAHNHEEEFSAGEPAKA